MQFHFFFLNYEAIQHRVYNALHCVKVGGREQYFSVTRPFEQAARSARVATMPVYTHIFRVHLYLHKNMRFQ